jgi:hypothetical protein
MTMHTRHPDSPEHGLADGCERCAEHAAHPFESLDDGNLTALIERTRLWMRDEEFPRSDNEAKAMSVVETALSHQAVLARLDRTRLHSVRVPTVAEQAKKDADAMFERAFGRKP